KRTSVAALLAAMPPAELDCAVVVDDEFEAAQAAARGVRCLKVKAGDRIDHVARIARAAPLCRIRVDANRLWTRDQALANLAALRKLPIDFVEEPCVDAHELLATT